MRQDGVLELLQRRQEKWKCTTGQMSRAAEAAGYAMLNWYYGQFVMLCIRVYVYVYTCTIPRQQYYSNTLLFYSTSRCISSIIDSTATPVAQLHLMQFDTWILFSSAPILRGHGLHCAEFYLYTSLIVITCFMDNNTYSCSDQARRVIVIALPESLPASRALWHPWPLFHPSYSTIHRTFYFYS